MEEETVEGKEVAEALPSSPLKTCSLRSRLQTVNGRLEEGTRVARESKWVVGVAVTPVCDPSPRSRHTLPFCFSVQSHEYVEC